MKLNSESRLNVRIILEGPNGAGKTTVAKALSDSIGVPVYAPFADRRDIYDLWFTEPTKALKISIDILSNFPSVGVFDRYHLTPQTMINHPLLFLPYVSRNDIVILLDASTETLKMRQQKRLEVEDVDPDLFYRPHYARLAESWNAFHIDTTDLGLDEVTDRVLKRYAQVTNGELFFVKEGRSKRIWRKEDKLLVDLKPTLDSYSHGRSETLLGTESLRNSFFEKAIRRFRSEGVPIIDYVREGHSSYSSEYCYSLPFEFIVKKRAVGTTLSDCPGLFYPNMPFPYPVVRFDYRTEPRDIPIPAGYLLNFGLDPGQMTDIVHSANSALSGWLSDAGYELIDVCFVLGFSEDGEIKIISEISPDCMRVRRGGQAFDKDLFRNGKSANIIIEAWSRLIDDLA